MRPRPTRLPHQHKTTADRCNIQQLSFLQYETCMDLSLWNRSFLYRLDSCQVIEAEFNSRKPKLVIGGNNFLLYARENPVLIVFEHLDLASLHIFGFQDASFERNVDHSTQLDFIIFSETASTEPIRSISSLTNPRESSVQSYLGNWLPLKTCLI